MAVVGPGAIGGAISGALADAGNTPLICARTGFSELIVEYPGGSISARPSCITAPDQTLDQASPVDRPVEMPVDVVVLAVKAHQTAGAADWLKRLVGPTTTLVVAQNGVEHRERVQHLVPADTTVVPAIVWCPAERSAPGRIQVTGRAVLVVPDEPGGRVLAELLAGSFFDVRLSDDFTSRAWDKLLINVALGGLGVLTGQPGSVLAGDPVTRDLMVQLMHEILPVARAEGAVLADDRPQQILDGISGGKAHLSSIAADRKSGLPTEWDARNAVVARFAARHGIDVPLNDWITALVRLGEPSIS